MALMLALIAVAAADELTLSLPVNPESSEGQRLIAERAIRHCGGRYPQLGRYRFSGREVVAADGTRQAVFEVRQELECVDASPPPPAVQPAPADWRASPEDERQVRAATLRFFSLVDSGNTAQLHEFCQAPNQKAASPEECVGDVESFRREAGAPGQHRIVAVTWYVNPAEAPTPGIYVAVDFERSYEKLLINCGYLVWFRESAGRYVLARQESNLLSRENSDGSPQSVAQARSLMHCAAG